MNTPTPRTSNVERVLRAYYRQRALGVDDCIAVRTAAAQLHVSRETVIKALALRGAAAPTLRLVA